MATYQSSQTTTFAAASSVTITKPTSLAVGDLLVAHLYFDDGSGSPGSYTIPSGWTEQFNVLTTGASFNPCRLQVLIKVADSADVAASNFTFTGPAAGTTAGGLSRVTSYGKVSGSTTTTQNDSTSSPVSFSGFTPDRADCLLMVFTCILGSASGSTPSLGTVSVATSNPTWTERYDLNGSVAGFHGLAMTTATRPEVTATGNFSVAVGLPANADIAIAAIAIAPALSATTNPTPLTIPTRIEPVQSPAVGSFSVQTISSTTETPTIWTPIDKS